MPAGARGRATVVQKEAGRDLRARAGAARVRASSIPTLEVVERRAARGSGARPGAVVLVVERRRRARCWPPSARRSTSSRTSRASRRWPRARSRRSRAPARACSTRARRRPGCARSRRQAVAAGGGANHRRGPLRRDPDQGEPHRDGRRDRRRGGGGARARARRCRSRSRCATRPRSTRRSPPARRGCCSTTWTSTELRAAVAQVGGRAELEASGGVTLETLRAVGGTGVDFVSMGALTHSAPALDLSLTRASCA